MIKTGHVIEYALLRAIAAFVRVLPYRPALAFAYAIAWLGHYVVRFRAAEARSRIRQVFGNQWTEAQVRRTAWLAWRNFMFSAIEMMRLPCMDAARIGKTVEDSDSIAPLLDYSRSGRGAIVATLHMGSWEMASAKCIQYRLPFFSLAAQQKNPLVDAYINRMRAATGFETVLRNASAMRAIIQRIRQGKVLAILSDVRSPAPGISVDFLGMQANIAWGMGVISHQTGAPVFPVAIRRVGWTRHVFRVFPAIETDPNAEKRADAARITQAVFDVFDKCVRESPEQWFWFNKRWLFDPLPRETAND